MYMLVQLLILFDERDNINNAVIVKNQTGCLSIATGVVVNPQPATPTTSTITFN